MDKNRKSIWLYLVLVFVLTWTLELLLVCPHYADTHSSDKALAAQAMALVSVCMFVPALCVLLTRLLLCDWSDCRLRLHLKGNAAAYLVGWFGPLVLVVLGAVLWFVLNPQEFVLNTPNSVPGQSAAVNWVVMVLLLLAAPLLNLVACFGEEWGWRGFLMPRLCERHSFNTSALITGLVWGIWHAPLLAVGHNYGQVLGEDSFAMVLAAIGMMVLFCVAISFLLGLIAERAQSVWPAVLAHGCLNGSAGLALMFTPAMQSLSEGNPYNAFIGPLPVGIVGGFAFLVVAIWLAIGMSKANRN